jgi:hypothetical protein
VAVIENFVGIPNNRDEKAHNHIIDVFASSAARALVGKEQSG